MQLLKSLFCLPGFDNRSRFFAICSTIYIVFILLSSAFSGVFVFSFLLSALFSGALGLTSLRRLNDAKLNRNWLFAPSVSFALVALIIIWSEQHSSYYLLLIPALSSAVLLTYPSKTKGDYTLGYIGPVDMSEYQQNAHQGKAVKFRIEPSLTGNNTVNIDLEAQEYQQAHQTYAVNNEQTSQGLHEQTDIGELIRLKLLSNKKVPLAIVTVLAIILAAVLISWLISFFSTNEATKMAQNSPQKVASVSPNIVRAHSLTMPDNFTLYLTQHQGVIINWQADEVSTANLWSQFSGQGDKSCQQISFNKGKPLRTLSVDVERKDGLNTEYFASFSPLDSQALIQALAFRGNFSLCGYDFSLKGSQAVLGKNSHYAQWLNY